MVLLKLHCDAQPKIIVDKNEKGKYKTLQSALDAIPSNDNKPVIIYIKKGIYFIALRL